MSNVLTFQHRAHIRIESGRVNRSDSPELVGKWVYMVSYIDEDGGGFFDYIGTSKRDAEDAALAWARDAGLKVIDRSDEELRS